jgi:hypothetical protein
VMLQPPFPRFLLSPILIQLLLTALGLS